MPDPADPPAAATPEPREAPPWRPQDGPLRTRTWPKGGPTLEIHAEGAWRRAQVTQRQTRADGTVVYGVWIILPSVSPTSATYRTYAWDPHCMRPLHDATEPPAEQT